MRKRLMVVSVGVATFALVAGIAAAGSDFGAQVQKSLQSKSNNLFGVAQPLLASSSTQVTQAQAQADPTSLFTLAGGLKARVVTSGVGGGDLDQIGFWPSDKDPQWLIECNEEDPTKPGLQRINVATGEVDTIVTGTSRCDPVRVTPWGSILFAEEAGAGPTGGHLYEMLDPIGTTGVALDRTTGTFSGGTGASNLVDRGSVGMLSFEGLAVYASGLMYYSDESRPLNGNAGGAYYKFIPDHPRPAGSGPITSLDQSPLVSGSIYGLRVGAYSGNTDYGQGTSTGFGTWQPVCSGGACSNIDLRPLGLSSHLTGFYRPEDAAVDPAQAAMGYVRVCWTNTGNEENGQDWGEVLCFTDGAGQDALTNSAVPEVQRLVEGSPALAMPDNVDFQPKTGNLLIDEDADTGYLTPHNNDIWDCLPDGSDPDLQSDGCVRVATLNDLTAEWTGGTFTSDGKHYYVSIQHNVSGASVVIDITGW